MEVNFAGPLTRVVPVEESSQVGQARREALLLAEACDFEEVDRGRVALVATELATNVLKHGGGGRLLLSRVQGRRGPGVELCAIDQGPGFVLSQCLPDGYSTSGTQGTGLGAIQRQAALLESWSDGHGAIVMGRLYAQADGPDADLPYGALRLPLRHEQACGDAWHLRIDGPRQVVTLIDGLGHGAPAEAAAEAGIGAAERAGQADAAGLVARLHAGMSGTRGGAAAVACVDEDSGRLQFAGVGNISAVLCDLQGTRGLPSHPGIVGVQYRKAQAFEFHTAPGNLLIMHSDGLQARWNLAHYPGLFHRHPTLIAAVLHRDFDRGRDDASVIVLRLGVPSGANPA